MEQRIRLPAILLGTLASFFALGFLQNFYPSLWGFVLFTVFLNVLFTLVFEIVLERAAEALRSKSAEKLPALGALTLGMAFMALTFRLLAQYPTLFSLDFFLPDPQSVLPFLGLTVLAQGGLILLHPKLDATGWRTSPLVTWIQRVLPGLLAELHDRPARPVDDHAGGPPQCPPDLPPGGMAVLPAPER